MEVDMHSNEGHGASLPPPAVGTEETPRPRSVVDMAIDSASNNPAGRQVRRNLITRLSDRWENLPRNSRIILSLNGVMTFAKIIASTTALVVDRDATCISPNLTYLKVLIGLYALRSAIAFPFTVYSHLHPRIQGAPLTRRDINLERQRTLMEVIGTCLFFLSNYFLFSGTTCRETAPAVFYLTVVYVILGYIVILIPVILCLTVILCLPLVLRVMRYFNIGPVVGVKGATEEMIASIPIVKYRTPATAQSAGSGSNRGNSENERNRNEQTGTGIGVGTTLDTAEGQNAEIIIEPVPSASTPDTASRRGKKRLFGFFHRSRKDPNSNSAGKPQDAVVSQENNANLEYLTLEDEQDAVCAICLCEYKDDEELRKMRCTHYFHKDCVDEWLRLHRNCPLCKRDIEDLSSLRNPPVSAAGSSAVETSPLTPQSAGSNSAPS
ncbi:hypothetical protein FBU30_004801 [Linnemannia zychae]|nr:hypothetical protein FBU30_004801 [Linnemannia zychae]